MGGMQDRKLRSNYRKSRKRARAEYQEALSVIKRIEASIKVLDKDHGLSLDLNKIAHLAKLHDRMLNRLCGIYNIKDIFLDAAR